MAVVVAAIVILVLSQTGTIDESPWTMIALVAGTLAVLASLLITMIEASYEPAIGGRRKP